MTRASDTARLVSGGAVINEASNDVDFRVESNGNTHALFVDAGNDHVNINTDSDLGSTLNVNGEITCANADAGLLLVENAADANGSNFTMRKSRNTTLNGHTVVQQNDVLGNINFQGSDGTDFHSGASIAVAVDATPGNNDMPGRLVFSTTVNDSGSPTERMRINHHGRMSINATDDTTASIANRVKINCNNEALFGLGIEAVRNTDGSGGIIITNNETSGTFTHLSFKASDNDTVGSIRCTDSSTTYNTSSDYRLKENVSYDFDATTRLKKLKPARFNFKKDKDNIIDGFIAHEVSDIVPNAVSGTKDALETYTDDDGKEQTRPLHQGMDHSKLVPLLTKSLQEALARIDTLEAEVAKLKG